MAQIAATEKTQIKDKTDIKRSIAAGLYKATCYQGLTYLNTPGRTRTFDPLLRSQRRTAHPVGSPSSWSVSFRPDSAHSEKIEQ
jgi:hypothetical protein